MSIAVDRVDRKGVQIIGEGQSTDTQTGATRGLQVAVTTGVNHSGPGFVSGPPACWG
jgi:hypothetical protein